MLGRYVLIVLGLIAIIWTGYVAIDLIDKKDELSPKVLFGVEDNKVLIVHRATEIDWSAIDFKPSEKMRQLWEEFQPLPSYVQSIYFSSNRDHLLLESSELWSRKSVIALFSKMGQEPQFDGIHSFKTNQFNGRIYRNRLYISTKDYATTPIEDNWLIQDKKSSASLLTFNNEGFELTDIYFKKDGKVEYISKRSPNAKGNQINDKDLFSHALPSELEEYHFYEREFLASSDDIFAKSPMYDWIDKGLVHFSVDGYQVIISDYKESQDPVNSLFDFVKRDPENQPYGYFQNLELMKGFPAVPNQGFYAYSMDDFVVMSSNQQLCERIVADYKLGNTLIKNENKTKLLFGQLPINVSERYCGKNQPFSRSVYKGLIFQTSLPGGAPSEQTPEENNEKVDSYKMGGEIHDFNAFSGAGNIIAVTRSGLVKYYRNGEKKWERNLGGEPVGKIELSKLTIGDHWLITTKNGIHLLNSEGGSPAGFPAVVADRQLACNAVGYTWKGKSGILAANSKGEILVFDQKGKRTAVIQTNLSSVEQPVDVWVSNKKLYYGIRDSQTFKMIDADKRKEFRSFALPSLSFSFKGSNELNLFCIQQNDFIHIDQKGSRNSINGYQGYVIRDQAMYNNELLVALNSGNTIKVLNDKGQLKNTLKTEANQIDDISLNFLNSGKTVLGIVDGLENDVYLYGLNGQMIGKGAYEGSQKTMVTEQSPGKYILTTIVDDFVVQYTVN